MKKILLLVLPLMVMCFASCEKEEEWTDDSPIIQFKDPKFLEELLDRKYSINFKQFQIDRNGDGQISEKEAATATSVSAYGGIRNMDEIKYFTAITYLGCSENQLTSLDVSNNTSLTNLYCSTNQLITLDVSNNMALTILWCFDNKLTSLDISNCTALTDLWCYDNQLTSLNVSNNTALTRLLCSNNQLTTLDLSKNTSLTTLECRNNPSLKKIILYKYHMLNDDSIQKIEEEYGDIIEYVE